MTPSMEYIPITEDDQGEGYKDVFTSFIEFEDNFGNPVLEHILANNEKFDRRKRIKNL